MNGGSSRPAGLPAGGVPVSPNKLDTASSG